MNETLSATDLDNLPTGAEVKDSVSDTWTKQEDGLWTAMGIGGYYSDWTSERMVDQCTVTQRVEAAAEELPVLDIKPELNLRAQTLAARENFDSDGIPGYSATFFDQGVNEGWFTNKFFEDWAQGVRFNA